MQHGCERERGSRAVGRPPYPRLFRGRAPVRGSSCAIRAPGARLVGARRALLCVY